jgi:hypothetical protein
MKLFHSIKRFSERLSAAPVREPVDTDATDQSPPDAAGVSTRGGLPVDNPAAETAIDEIIRVERVKNAEFYVGDLFRRRFGGDPPDYPIHFVAFYRFAPSRLQAIGYVHYMVFEDSYLCGGLVIDERLYRRMESRHRRVVKASGGIAEILLRAAMVELADAAAIWGYVGDLLSEKVNVRVGLRRTAHRYLMVHWSKPLAQEDEDQRLARVAALGPF